MCLLVSNNNKTIIISVSEDVRKGAATPYLTVTSNIFQGIPWRSNVMSALLMFSYFVDHVQALTDASTVIGHSMVLSC